MRDRSPAAVPLSDRLRRVVSPSLGARANAAAALEEMAESADGFLRHGSDLALLIGHPAGLSQSRANGRLGTALWEVFSDHVALLDRDGTLVSVNAAWRSFALENGGTATASLGSNYLRICDAAAADGEPEAGEAAEHVRAALAGVRPTRKLYYACADRWFSMQAIPIPGQHSGALVVHTDTTADRHEVQRWRHQALHDPLTGLPNRALLQDRLAHAVASTARNPNSLAVLFADLDGFKTVNDTHGHAAGDRVLVEVAARMAASVRSGDTIGRWGGDEFLVVAEQLESPDDAVELAQRLTASLGPPIGIGGVVVPVGITVGLAHAHPGQSPEELVDAADQSLQHLRRARGRSSARCAMQQPAAGEVRFHTSARRAFPRSHRSPALSRQMVREVLDDQPEELVETVKMLTSELVTNAVLHARSMTILQVQASTRLIRITVEDTSFRPPQPRETSDFSETGRGLHLVNTLATSWGWNRTSTGKAVWFETDLS